MGATAAELKSVAYLDAAAAALPTLADGQYYYQESQVSLVCQFSSPSMPSTQLITYVSDGTMQSWSNSAGQGRVTITPSPIGTGGSHFATPGDKSEWLEAGSPYVPCALSNASNQLGGNPANASTTSPSGYASSGVAYVGFGFNLASNSVTTDLLGTTNINNLPANVSQIASMLANGEINVDGSSVSAPQPCRVDNPLTTGMGCNYAQQLGVIEQLLQLPDASSKLGSTLYNVMAQMPGAVSLGRVTTIDGDAGDG